MNELSKQQIKNFLLILSGLMVIAFFLPAFSIMDKDETSFWGFLKYNIDNSANGKIIYYVIPLLLMLAEPVYSLYKIMAKDSVKVLLPALVAGGSFCFFMLAFYSDLKLGSSGYLDFSKIVSFRVGFYLYLFSAVGLTYISYAFAGIDAATGDIQEGKMLQNRMKRLIPSKKMAFIPMGWLDKFEVSHFDNSSHDDVYAARVARISIVLGVVMACIGSDIVRRLNLYVDVSTLLIFTLILSALVACYFLLPVIKGAKSVNDKVLYTGFAILIALITAYIGFAFAFFVVIYIVIYLVVNSYRTYVVKSQEQEQTENGSTDKVEK